MWSTDWVRDRTGQVNRVLAALEQIILQVADASRAATLDDLGGCAFRSDLAAMRHETQYTRLFRS